MNATKNRHPDAARSQLRAAVAILDAQIVQLPGSDSGLASSWANLVGLLALGPEPELRECPVCGNFGMRKATLCGHCWTKLPPLADTRTAGT